MTESKHNIPTVTGRTILLALLFIIICAPANAQIVIGGDVYGGGRNGAVGTAKVTDADAAKESVTFATGSQASDTTTSITINSGSVRTVFGGGQNGRTYGSTSVKVKGSSAQIGGEVNGIDWTGSINGGLFGAGDGEQAYVFGNSNVTIKDGSIQQNVYGGGNQADLMGTTNVTLQGGQINATVFGGARLANIYGYSFVDIDGANLANDLIISSVYGGNDIAGDINAGTSWNWTKTENLTLPSRLTKAQDNEIDNTWNAFVHSSLETTGKHIFVGQLYGGGNGDYTYTTNSADATKMDMSELTERTWNSSTSQWEFTPHTFTVSKTPEVDKVYLELKGGTYGYVYGGGNKATVTGNVDICLDNSTENLYQIEEAKLTAMGVSVDTANFTVANSIATPQYQFDRVFGGNNKAAMNVHPNWHLTKASINNLYSGGNAGNMTYPDGLMLSLTSSDLTVNTVYGGCRMADVAPTGNNIPAKDYTIDGVRYTYPADHSARLLITAGNINYVYGGNDISGNVFGGTALEILHSINHEVYGGGNGSYVYTDLASLQNDAAYGDFYYSIPSGYTSAQALNEFRPSTSKTYIHVAGTGTNPVSVQTVYGGGNSTTVTDGIHLQLGEYVTIDNVFLGSNGAQMVTESTLTQYADNSISSLDLTDSETFNTYMMGAAVSCMPTYEFDNGYYNDKNTATLANIGSFYCGGNVGSMTSSSLFDISFSKPIKLTNKLVGGCNTAFVAARDGLNARHEGGFTGATTSDKIRLNIEGIIFDYTPASTATIGNQGNIFGGCFESGIIQGNVTILLKENIIPATYFASDTVRNTYLASESNLFSTPLSVFGGGFGPDATIKGNTTISVYDGSSNASGGALKVFGGGYGGRVEGNTMVNIYGENSFAGRIYGGGFEGNVTGNTMVNLDGGTVYNSFGGACNADISGYAQTYAGAGMSGTAGLTTILGSIYGGNDFGGRITGLGDFSSRLKDGVSTMVYNPSGASVPSVLQASAYVEYQQGNVADYIFGGCCGSYDYDSNTRTHVDPYLTGSFVNLRPLSKTDNTVSKVFGAGQGYSGSTEQANHQDKMQDRSYVLVNIPDDQTNFTDTEVFGAGAYSGLGMRLTAEEAQNNLDSVTAVVDLVSGTIKNAYGAGYNEGVTRRTVVNVPQGSTAVMANLFGGGYGYLLSSPCDAIETNVNWSSGDAVVTGAVFGGNNNCRRTLFSTINVNSKVRSDLSNPSYTGWIYGGGLGADTWSYYTVVNLNANTDAYMVYGGGNAGNVLNKESFAAWKTIYDSEHTGAALYDVLGSDYDTPAGMAQLESQLVRANGLDTITNTNVYFNKGSYLSGYCYGGGKESDVSGSTYIGLHGGYISKDMYAAGESGDICDLYRTGAFTPTANAFVEGGKVRRVYGGGWKGNVGYTQLPFTVSADTLSNSTLLETILSNDLTGVTNVVIGIDESEARLRNMGSDYNYYKGIPAVEWNAYGGGERGGIIGTANLTVYNGYIGYRYFDDATDDPDTEINEKYQEKVDDETADDKIGRNYLIEHGNLFGGGYDDGSYTDYANVRVYGGYIRNSVYGGGEIAAIGRGQTKESGQSNTVRELLGIAKAGGSNVEIYSGNILRSVFGGGKGYSATRAEDYAFSASRRYTDGYVFGQTAANIYGGRIGTPTTLLEGEGNVFGGGNIGYVYTKLGKKYEEAQGGDGYYYKVKSDGSWDLSNGEMQFTEDSKVVVSPYSRVYDGQEVTINGQEYKGAFIDDAGVFHHADYVPTSALNTISLKSSLDTTKMDLKSGVIISNAVFAGGNVSQGSDLLYAEAKTVFGNATASIVDLYCMDLITLGQEGTGGLYGDGNLTFVDGYRELNITNYGTDYYGLLEEITYEEYLKLNDRERAYFQLKYVCITATDNFNVGDEIESDDYNDMSDVQKACFKVSGVCSIYAGRMMNTVQRADYCGVFGSRMVMKGARDRVPAEVDYTNYTINRVGEVALHKRTVNDDSHGNYFGIYNIVNYLGALTSDVKFTDTMPSGGNTYYDYKSSLKGKRSRNNGQSHNEVALASGVYLELLQEPYRNYVGEDKVYGPITGVVQLNLIAASVGEGGGYVYAKNIHGGQTENTTLKHLILAESNTGGITHKAFSYDSNLTWMQSSGNFVSDSKTIIDECFPTVNSYDEGGSEAHYWFIKGDFYVYNQEISAYTGSAQSYIKNVSIPLTILAQGNGRIKIEDIKTNLYADATKFPNGEESVVVNGITYYNNDPITWWDYYNLSSLDQQYFVNDSYVCANDVWSTADGADQGADPAYAQGTVFTVAQYNALTGPWYDNKGDEIAKDRAFRHTNALTHDNGYMLAVSLDQPQLWDEYYTHISRGDTMGVARYNAQNKPEGYKLAPTYKLTGSAGTYIFGQSQYDAGDLVGQAVIDNYASLDATAKSNLSGQATFSPAYMAMTTCDITINGETHHVVERSAISEAEYNAITDATEKSYFSKAFIALETIKLTDKLLLSADQLYSFAELDAYAQQFPQLITTEGEGTNKTFNGFPRAYYCTEGGSYGGAEFTTGQNYQATMYANLTPEERQKFVFNYDALDIMLDPTYSGDISYYDKPNGSNLYSSVQKIDYQAKYIGQNDLTLYGYGTGFTLSPVNGTIYSREQFESLANERRHYSQINTNVTEFVNGKDTLYIVSEEFGKAGSVYCKGDQIDAADYKKLSTEQQSKISTLILTNNGNGTYSYSYSAGSSGTLAESSTGALSFYLCTEGYTKPNSSETVAEKTFISQNTFDGLANYQKDFEVVAGIPEEKSALYVSRDCDIYDFTGDRIFTVIYRYNYNEPNDEGDVFKNVSERHILNIRVHFESGEPIIGELIAPAKMLPGTIIGLTTPSVQKGAFEVLGGGWELYENENNALTHKNGVPYTNYVTPMYWYQDNWYVAYYAETYLGRTFSNPVPFSIANYHDIDDVMADSITHMHIDHPGVKSNSRVYIDNRNTSSDKSKSKLDLLYDLFDLSLQEHQYKNLLDEEGHIVTDDNGHPIQIDDYDIGYTRSGALNRQHSALNEYVKGLENLELILKSNVEPKAYTDWTPIGTETYCFEGTLHGNGYTVSGIDKSLFGHLCDSVFNLGVRGAIDGAGIADVGGYAQNVWLINDTTIDLSGKKAIMGTGIVVNGYYNDESASTGYAGGNNAISKPMSAFLNGEVAYNLNGFYLNKRYKDHSGSSTGTRYYYYTVNTDNSLSEPVEGRASDNILYVERYYMDGQFVYAGGSIPSGNNIRYYEQNNKHYPIYPDDYIYFGQKLTYGLTSTAHAEQPGALSRSGAFINKTTSGNRVYRAPAYYGSSDQDMAYFNANAAFAATYQGTDAYAGMTAIDFTGYNDATWTDGTSQDTYFKPTLDYAGLTGFNVQGITKNLLVYADYANDGSSYSVLQGVLTEPEFSMTDNTYNTVSVVPAAQLNSVKGHLVKKNGTGYQANSRQFLVDMQDFNAPISYSFDTDDFMWYQRTPQVYVENQTSGWDVISLPFTADLVTTQTKGEITHFYTGSKTGHEYWLRSYSGISSDKSKAEFSSLAASNVEKTVTNTFLWDYYYSKNSQLDKNADEYQTYYNSSREYSDYPLYAAGTPYLIGFPGNRYYEFDLSGQFTPANTATPAPAQLDKQTIIFCSNGSDIEVTDTEYENAKPTGTSSNAYYMPTYQAQTVSNAYLIDAGGTKFTQHATATTVPFRAYIQAASSQGVQKRGTTRASAIDSVLYISYTGNDDLIQERANEQGLNIYSDQMNIVIESTLDYEATVTITTMAGRNLKQFSIQPGTKVTVPVNNRGVYIVNRKKIAVTR